MFIEPQTVNKSALIKENMTQNTSPSFATNNTWVHLQQSHGLCCPQWILCSKLFAAKRIKPLKFNFG